MKNSVFKTYSKKMLRNEVIISAISVFVIAISIIGFSYALYMDVDTDTEYELMNVGDLAIGFDNGDNVIDLKNMTPTDDEIAVTKSDNLFSFYIYNKGSYTASYAIKLEELDGNEVSKNYINFQICKENAKNCDEVKTLSDIEDGIIYKDELNPKKDGEETPSLYYFIRMWINNKYDETLSKNIKLKAVVDAVSDNKNLDNELTLNGKIINNKNIKINNNIPDLTKIESEQKGLYKTKDNYGTSYYFRGDSDYNYVLFANKCFRVVRIEGDGSTKLVLYNNSDNCNEENWNIGNTNVKNDNLYVEFENSLKNYLNNMKKTYWCKKDNTNPTLVCVENDSDISYVNALSKDELIFAGTEELIKNDNSYLRGNYWTNVDSYSMTFEGYLIKDDNELKGNRPAIVLKNDTLVISGDGTKIDPYRI